MDEWLDIYDEHQRPTGRLRRRGDPIEPGERYLVVTVFVRDSGGRFLTTRRSPQKAYYPGCWEVTKTLRCRKFVPGSKRKLRK